VVIPGPSTELESEIDILDRDVSRRKISLGQVVQPQYSMRKDSAELPNSQYV